MLNAMLLDGGKQTNANPRIFVSPKVAMAKPKKETTAKFAYDLVSGGGSDSDILAVVYKIGRDPWCVRLNLVEHFSPEDVRNDIYALMVSEAKVVLKRPNGDQFHGAHFDEKRRPRTRTLEKLVNVIEEDYASSIKLGTLIIS